MGIIQIRVSRVLLATHQCHGLGMRMAGHTSREGHMHYNVHTTGSIVRHFKMLRLSCLALMEITLGKLHALHHNHEHHKHTHGLVGAANIVAPPASKAPSLFRNGHFYGSFIFCFDDRSAIVKSFGAHQTVIIPASIGNHCNIM